jgi:hypothetical protein
VVVACVAWAVACGGRSERPKGTGAKAWTEQAPSAAEWPPSAPFVTPGERMAYKLTMHELEVASFHIAIGDVSEVEGRQVVLVQTGVAASQLVSMVKKVEDSFAAWIDVRTGRPVLFRSSELAGANDQAIETTDAEVARGDGKTFPVRVTRAEGEIVEQQTVSEHVLFDMNGFLIALRSWDVPAGTTATADVVRSRYLWRTQVTMAKFETIVTELGELPAVRIDGVSRRLRRDGTIDPSSDTRHYSMWISDDADRVPLAMVAKTDYGDLRMDIVEYLPGSGTPLGR